MFPLSFSSQVRRATWMSRARVPVPKLERDLPFFVPVKIRLTAGRMSNAISYVFCGCGMCQSYTVGEYFGQV